MAEAHQNNDEENEDDDMPDWRQFAKFAAKSMPTGISNAETNDSVVFIPRRGEKDFEPIKLDDQVLQAQGTTALLSDYQSRTLNESRAALFSAISSGTRSHSSKSYNSFTWRPQLEGGRATCDSISSYGIHFLTVGRHNTERKRVELFPEEALYLVERGVLELWKESTTEAGEVLRVPMSVQQAWVELIGSDELTLERFQVYTYLKRLGYVVIRARSPAVTPASRRVDRTPVATPPFELRDLLRRPFLFIRTIFSKLLRGTAIIGLILWPKRARLTMTRVLKVGEGTVRSLTSGRRWASYDSIFSHLQIIPSGHDLPVFRSAPSHSNLGSTILSTHPSVAAYPSSIPVPTLTESTISPNSAESLGLPNLNDYPYQTFYNVYKPVTKYKKASPPEPDFRMVVINAAITPLPNMFEFDAMFSSIPFSDEDTLLPPPRPVRAFTAPPSASPASKRRSPPPPLTGIPRLLALFSRKEKKRVWKPSPYPRLKMGRRNIIVVIVDNGTSSFLRFSETEFAKVAGMGGMQGRAS